MNAGDLVRRELAKTPATAYELGVELGWTMRRASAWCANLLCAGEVRHVGQVRAGTRLSYLYGLTEKGASKIARRKPGARILAELRAAAAAGASR